jgi:hypothetical protein
VSLGEVVKMFGDAPEPNSVQAFQNCYDNVRAVVNDLSDLHDIDYDGAVIATIAALLDQAEAAAPEHEVARDVLSFVKERCSRITE